MAVQGNLKDMSLTSPISINCNEMNQSRLSIRHQRQEATLFFEEGNIVHSALASQEGDEVIYALLTWEEGVFELEQGVPPPSHTVTAGGAGRFFKRCLAPAGGSDRGRVESDDCHSRAKLRWPLSPAANFRSGGTYGQEYASEIPVMINFQGAEIHVRSPYRHRGTHLSSHCGDRLYYLKHPWFWDIGKRLQSLFLPQPDRLGLIPSPPSCGADCLRRHPVRREVETSRAGKRNGHLQIESSEHDFSCIHYWTLNLVIADREDAWLSDQLRHVIDQVRH